MFGTQIDFRSIANAEGLGGDGAFEVIPIIWAQMRKVRAAIDGYCIPRACALLPNKSQYPYRRMWGAIRGLIGEEEGMVANLHHGLSAILHRRDSAYIPTFQRRMVHLPPGGAPLSIGAGTRTIWKYPAGDGFRRLVETLSALALLLLGKVTAGRILIGPTFGEVGGKP